MHKDCVQSKHGDKLRPAWRHGIRYRSGLQSLAAVRQLVAVSFPLGAPGDPVR